MRARGEQLAKDGRFTEAIDAFKAAERLEPRARHACLIALAYIRRELWPQAEIFLEQCESRATAADPVPEWVPTAKQQLKERLDTVNVAAVTIRVEPGDADVKLAVSSFAPDELFGPRTIHLPPGRHVIIATAKGYNDAQKTIDVSDKSPQEVTITMLPLGSGTGPGDGSHPPPPPPPAPASKVPYYVMGAGGAIAIGGLVSHLVWFVPKKNQLQDDVDANDRAAYASHESAFDTSKRVTIGLYAVGGALVVTGAILKFTVFKGKESPAQVALAPYDGGGMLTVGWSR